MVEGPDGPVGSLRFDRVGEEAEVSVVVAPEARGDGLAADAVREASELQLAARPELVRIRAQLRASNEASLKSFERAGFAPGGDAGPGRRVLFRDRAALASRAR